MSSKFEVIKFKHGNNTNLLLILAVHWNLKKSMKCLWFRGHGSESRVDRNGSKSSETWERIRIFDSTENQKTAPSIELKTGTRRYCQSDINLCSFEQVDRFRDHRCRRHRQLLSLELLGIDVQMMEILERSDNNQIMEVKWESEGTKSA